ncbi:SCO1664 family protein [Ornatilinea apprima]|uniref:SCO1664 family protein n=1 Tax=Ornatilinea apprima TaxID=1134406 RepID=UPI000B065E16|nr:SCO1664 family protein [Ornatilinea apprima]
MNKTFLLEALQKGVMNLQGQFLNSSNYTFLTQLAYQGFECNVVYKPVKGEMPLWDFPNGTLAQRETAAFVLSEALGWDLVPPTVFRKKAALGPGSVQYFVEHDPQYHFFEFSVEDRQRLRPAALFDLLANNADRKGGHILIGAERHIYLIDHGICFNREPKLRTVIWDFAGEALPPDLLEDVRRLSAELEQKTGAYTELRRYLSAKELDALRERALALLEAGVFPHPDPQRRPYPWPPV